MDSKLNYNWSKYQLAIFNFIENENGNLVVEAAAGSGKSSTLVKSVELIPSNKKILMSAFNKDIVMELTAKIKGYGNVDAKTLHGLGYSILNKNFPDLALSIEDFKYDAYLKDNIRMLSSIDTRRMKRLDYLHYLDNIRKYTNYGRFYLCENEADLSKIEETYDIDTIADEKEIALRLFDWGKEYIDVIDFTDMIWLPNVLDLPVDKFVYDYIMIDEAQDLNRAERELMLKCSKPDTRIIAIGDPNQMIYSFAGADPNSLNALKSLPNTSCLPLSISYRCPKTIVEYAQKLVPTIEANDENDVDGKIIYDVQLEDVQDGDMILCRNNAPLVKVYNDFLKMGKKAYIRGKDVGANLKKLVKMFNQKEINITCVKDGLFVRLYDDLFTTRSHIMLRSGVDEIMAMRSSLFETKMDMINALEILSEGINNTSELIEKIDKIFPQKDDKVGISLSTIHKAKGLEANNVYIVCNSLMPSKSAQKNWELMQEHNLMYVAYTRSKKTLGFIDEKDFEKFDLSDTINLKTLERIEKQVNYVLGKTNQIVINEKNAKDIVSRAKPIDRKITSSSTVININDGKKLNSFSDLKKPKRKIKRK